MVWPRDLTDGDPPSEYRYQSTVDVAPQLRARCEAAAAAQADAAMAEADAAAASESP